MNPPKSMLNPRMSTRSRLGRLFCRLGGFAALFALTAVSAEVPAAEIVGLYQAETIVTGTREAERLRGFKVGMEEIIIKLSGDAELARLEKAKPLINRAPEFIRHYEYEDRKKGVPIHDEQGTRDRSFFLRMHFKRVPVDTELRALGVTPWGSVRPNVVIWLGIKDSIRSYVLGAHTAFGADQREVLVSVARRRGVPVVLPQMNGDERAGIGYHDVASRDLARIRRFSRRYGSDAVLFGTLVMDTQGYWTLNWSLEWNNRLNRNQLDGVTFDVALRNAVERTAKALSDSRQK